MTRTEAQEYGYEVEAFGGGFILCDYSGKRGKNGAAYAGKDGEWRSQPMGMAPFATEAEAWAAVK